MKNLILVFAVFSIISGAYAQGDSTNRKMSSPDMNNTRKSSMQNNQQDLNNTQNQNLQNNPQDLNNTQNQNLQNNQQDLNNTQKQNRQNNPQDLNNTQKQNMHNTPRDLNNTKKQNMQNTPGAKSYSVEPRSGNEQMNTKKASKKKNVYLVPDSTKKNTY